MPNVRALLKKWKSRPGGELHCAVMRHAERADSESAWSQDSWALSSDGQQWPFDPPLSDRGLADASVVAARELHSHHKNAIRSSEECWVVVSSPYLRCVQTAVEVCVELGPKSVLILDQELGEVYGPEIMGDHEPAAVRRPVEAAWQFCNSRHVKYRPQLLGRPPGWPETIVQMRTRVLRCFLRYLRRGALAHRNFVIVTHADGVGAALAAMPSMQGRLIERVEFCGMFFASASANVNYQKLAAVANIVAEVGGQSDIEEVGFVKKDGEPPSPAQPILKTTFGWEVKTSGVKLGPRCKRGWVARLRCLTQRTGFSEAEIARLLRCLPGQPLTEETLGERQESFPPRSLRRNLSPGAWSAISWSTYVFGASETDSSPWGSCFVGSSRTSATGSIVSSDRASSSRHSVRKPSESAQSTDDSLQLSGNAGRHASPLSTGRTDRSREESRKKTKALKQDHVDDGSDMLASSLSGNSSLPGHQCDVSKQSSLASSAEALFRQRQVSSQTTSGRYQARPTSILLPLGQSTAAKTTDASKASIYASDSNSASDRPDSSTNFEPVVCKPLSPVGASSLLQRRGMLQFPTLLTTNLGACGKSKV